MAMNSDKVKNHFYHPRNLGELDISNNNVKVGVAHTPDKSTVMQLHIQIENNKIVDAKFKALGSPWAIATMSLITELVIGKTVEAVVQISSREIIEALALPEQHFFCALLGEDAIKGAAFNRQSPPVIVP